MASDSINHPIAVANLLSSTGVTDVKVLQAAVLHDTVEDTHTTIGTFACHTPMVGVTISQRRSQDYSADMSLASSMWARFD